MHPARDGVTLCRKPKYLVESTEREVQEAFAAVEAMLNTMALIQMTKIPGHVHSTEDNVVNPEVTGAM